MAEKGNASSIGDELDDPGFSKTGSETVTAEDAPPKETAEVLDPFGEPWRNRTSNLLIKSQLLCQLS